MTRERFPIVIRRVQRVTRSHPERAYLTVILTYRVALLSGNAVALCPSRRRPSRSSSQRIRLCVSATRYTPTHTCAYARASRRPCMRVSRSTVYGAACYWCRCRCTQHTPPIGRRTLL